MVKFCTILTLSSLVLTAFAMPAAADIAVWRDPGSKAILSFPDTWKRINNQGPYDVLTIRAPGENDFAECKLRVTPEGRFKIFPVHYSPQIQRVHVSLPYWEEYYADYSNQNIMEVTDNAGLGQGFASMAAAAYITDSGAKMEKQSVAVASYYQNNIYTIECSAELSAYPKWHNAFMGVIKSVRLDERTNYAFSGYYRDFLQDRTLKVRGPNVFYDTYR